VARNASIETMIEENKNRQDVEHVCDESIKTAQAERQRRAEVESAYNLIRAESLANYRASVLVEKRRRLAEVADNLDSLRCIEIELEQSGVKAAEHPRVLPVLPSYRSSRSLKARREKERFDLIDAAAERDFIAVLSTKLWCHLERHLAQQPNCAAVELSPPPRKCVIMSGGRHLIKQQRLMCVAVTYIFLAPPYCAAAAA
jgi:hypothetical protein